MRPSVALATDLAELIPSEARDLGSRDRRGPFGASRRFADCFVPPVGGTVKGTLISPDASGRQGFVAPLGLLAMTCSLFLSLPFSLFALEIPQRPEGYVSDYAGMLSPETRASLTETLRRFEEETSNQVVVATFPSLEGEVLEDFSIRLFETWKLGQKDKDNGALLLIFKNDRKVRIEVGYGLEGVLPDAICKLIIENEIAPRFREGQFEEGIEEAINKIILATRHEYHPSPSSQEQDLGMFLGLGVVMGAFLPLAILVILFGTGVGTLLFHLFTHQKWDSLDTVAAFLGILPLLVYFIAGRTQANRLVLTSQGEKRSPDRFWSWGGSSGFGGGGFGGGGFSGGGGSGGGGGASGGW